MNKLICKVSSIIPTTIVPTKSLLFSNSAFRNRYNLLKEAEFWSPTDVIAWQTDQLSELLIDVYQGVEAVRNHWVKAGFNPKDFARLSHINDIPLYDKQFVKQASDGMFNSSFPKNKATYRFTGGSTGAPMKFALEQRQIYEEKAYFYYIWEKHGYRIGDKCVLLKGDKLASAGGHRLHEKDGIFNYLKLDSDYLVSEKHIDIYDAAIRKYGAKFLFGFPSSVYLLASLYVRTNRKAPQFDVIFLASENTYPDQINFIKDVFGANDVFYHYGHSEYATLAFKYHNNDKLGFVPFYGISQLIDDKGKEIQTAGKLGEIVVTGFSRAQPFIRYKTNDFAVSSDYESADYMKNYRSVERIEGRIQEFIVTKDERIVSICSMGAAHFEGMNSLVDTQYEQSEIGKLTFNIVTEKESHVSELFKNGLKIKIEEKLEHSVDVEICQVNQVNRTGLGKKSMIRQNLDIKKYIG